jgi:hypothetical protein
VRLIFIGPARDVIAHIRALALLEGNKPVLQLLAELGAGVRMGGVVH